MLFHFSNVSGTEALAVIEKDMVAWQLTTKINDPCS